MTTQEKISKAYDDIQKMQYQPTKHNVMIAADIMIQLEEAWREVGEKEQALKEANERIAQMEAGIPWMNDYPGDEKAKTAPDGQEGGVE